MGTHRSRATARVRVGLAVTFTLGLVACGDDDSADTTTTASSRATTAALDTSSVPTSESGSTSSSATPLESTATSKVPTTPAPAACTGDPVVVGVIASVEGAAATPSVMGGVEAAAQAVNRDCSAGRPLTLVTCDDQANPNQAADCGRKIVDSGAIALVAGGFNGITVGSYEPIVQDAGIPSIGNFAAHPSEFTSPTSFPFYTGLSRIYARAAILRAAGVARVSIVLPDEPAVQALVPTFEATIKAAGIAVDRFVFVPLDATDLAQYASQASDSDAILIFTDTKAEGFLQALLSSGVTPKNKVIVAPVLSQDEIDEFDGLVDGLYMSAQSMPLTETSNEGIAAYLAETDAAGVADVNIDGLIAWRALHVVADAIKQLPRPDAASLTEFMASYSFAPPESAPVDLTKPAFPDDPTLSKFRVFSREFTVWQVQDGEIGLAAPGFVDPAADFELS